MRVETTTVYGHQTYVGAPMDVEDLTAHIAKQIELGYFLSHVEIYFEYEESELDNEN